ncbi:FAD-dependent thymidylate synthase [Candidatus Saccharibacteria bacterium]|nr:FAD-dependent thymidylate synthase [Candidatus Saccharibacteria bacterium]
MKIINPDFEVLDEIDGVKMLQKIESAGRTCYKSESKITPDSAKKFVANIIRNGHESVIEHEKVSVRIICDRGVTHEIVRHRIASYSQESTRYCNYCNDKFGNELTFIRPFFWGKEPDRMHIWLQAMQSAENAYLDLIKLGASPQEARSVLPNSLKAEIIVTMNLREWRHFFKLRTDTAAHPQMREIAKPMLVYFQKEIPIVFDDIIPF